MKTSIWDRNDRLAGLRRFAVAITILNIAGHFFLGFEQSWAQPLIGLAAAYATELLLELIDARLNHRSYRFSGGARSWIDFMLSAHITGLACSMLLYANEQLWPIAFASSVAIASKALIRVRIGGGQRHVFNPSNLGITVTLLAFSWVGVAQPYMFTENLDGVGDWILPAILICLGTFLNARFTKRLPLIAAWLGGFALQAVLRSAIFGTPVLPALTPISGVAFLLYTFYMVTDPATTPSSVRGQIAFGAGVALAYDLLVVSHVVFGMFFALTIVCTVRGIALAVISTYRKPVPQPVSSPQRIVKEPVRLVREEA
jgi:Na+-translocating ferredoxin:NAD+ oxidoreductase RnfD subunit